MNKKFLDTDNLNVGLVKTNDGSTCILCDREFPSTPKEIHFLEDSFTVRVVYDMESYSVKDLSYPLEHDIVNIWRREQKVYFAYITNGEVQDIFELPVRFIN